MIFVSNSWISSHLIYILLCVTFPKRLPNLEESGGGGGKANTEPEKRRRRFPEIVLCFGPPIRKKTCSRSEMRPDTYLFSVVFK